MIDQAFLSKKNTSTASPYHQQHGNPGADYLHSYEALPPNFSLTANMLAGAFAGIAVSSESAADVCTAANFTIGAFGDVPRGSTEGMQLPHDLLIWPPNEALTRRRPEFKLSVPRRAQCTVAYRTLWSQSRGSKVSGHYGEEYRVL